MMYNNRYISSSLCYREKLLFDILLFILDEPLFCYYFYSKNKLLTHQDCAA